MALFGGRDEGNHSFGVISAFVLNLSLMILPFAAIATWQALQSVEVYAYEPTDQAKAQTRRALERAAAALIPKAADRRAYWSSLIQREIDEGDVHAARGFLLSAPAMLPPADASRLLVQLPTDADDDRRAATALAFLDDQVRRQYEAGASPLDAAAPGPGAAPAPAAGALAEDFFLLGDARDLALSAGKWIQGDPVDVFMLALSGVGVAATGENAAQIKAGASVIRAAKRVGTLSEEFTAHIQQRVFAAIAPARLKQELAGALAKPGDADAISKAFQASVDPAGMRALGEDLADVKAIADAATPSGAVRLISHARSAIDLKRLRLIADSGGDRAIAVAKRADSAAVLGAAKGALKFTPTLMFDFALLALALLGFAISVLATLAQALLQEWRHGANTHRGALQAGI